MLEYSLTMEEMAKVLGISVATVSRALNDKPGVGAATRLRVLELAAKENFTPNSAARGLVTAQTHTVAFLTAHRSVSLAEDYFYQRVMLGAQQELARHGYFLIVTSVAMEQLDDLASMSLFRGRRSDGVLLAGPEIPARSVLRLQAQGVSVVLVDNALPLSQVDCVLSEDELGGYNATRHLLEHGHRQIAILTGPLKWVSNEARYLGYRRAMEESGLPLIEFHFEDTTFESGNSAMQHALALHPELSAVFAVNDAMAIGAVRAARAAGRRVPQDLAIVGFDDIEAAAQFDPPLTTVKVNKRQMGVMAARRLMDLMAGEDGVPVRSAVGTQLIIRSSCGCSGPEAPVGD